MIDYVEIGPTPAAENCVQVGADDYYNLARAECQRFKDGLLHYFGEPPEGARLRIKSNPHDFGDYFEVQAVYDDNYEDAIDWAYGCESAPETWFELENSTHAAPVKGQPVPAGMEWMDRAS